MKPFRTRLPFLLLFAVPIIAPTQGRPAFVENRGQWEARARFHASLDGLSAWITEDGAVLDFNRFIGTKPTASQEMDGHARTLEGTLKGHVVRMSFVNARATTLLGETQLPGKTNYLLGNDTRRWASNCRRFGEANAEQIYDGIRTRYFFDSGRLRYDLILAAGADPGQIAMRFEGAGGISVLPNGNLRIQTSLGPIEERGLQAYQGNGNMKRTISCRMVVEESTVRFKVGNYDRGRPLVIDPLLFSTYFGGAIGDDLHALALDTLNNPVIAGATPNDYNSFPTTTGAYQRIYTGKNNQANAFVAKLTADGSLVFSTYIGGTSSAGYPYGGDCANSIAYDTAGNIVIAGYTFSSDFPTTAGAYQTVNKAFANGSNTGFIAKISADGSTLMSSSLLAGAGIPPTKVRPPTL